MYGHKNLLYTLINLIATCSLCFRKHVNSFKVLREVFIANYNICQSFFILFFFL